MVGRKHLRRWGVLFQGLGRSWQHLAIDGYLGILGFQPAQDRVFWANGNWYDNNDGRIYSYGLR